MSDNNTNKYNVVVQSAGGTVVAEYTPDKKRSESYQSEAALERAFIEQLKSQAYEYLPITNEQDLIINLRAQLEKLNDISFTDNEWSVFFATELANPNQSIEEKTKTIQEDHIKILKRDDGTTKNIYLIRKRKDVHDNSLQIINQYATDEGQRSNRYDATILVNGLPLAHIELKRRGVNIKEAFNQINRYQRESFWASSGLFEYIQLFIISNGTHTKYYSNTTRNEHIKRNVGGSAKTKRRSSNSFEFTSWWADATNRPITDLVDFSKTFFAKHTLLNMLTRYCVFTTKNSLLVMRPYQIVATEKILNKIEVSVNYKKLGSAEAGGYVWHTTGSGKTLTSFKAARLASGLPYVDKVLFVVDRKDLDYQTMQEYDKFEKGAANSNASSAILKKHLEDPGKKILITTIQKLDRFIKRNAGHDIFNGHIVLIFDECHRSQFGDMHTGITKTFKNYNIFGFTGTPIFARNSLSGGRADLKTTEQAFGAKLHTYTIVDAINDKNVLPFRVDYVKTARANEDIENKQISDIDREAARLAPQRVTNVVAYIRKHFDQKTKRNTFYEIENRRLSGFNSIFVVSSIKAAKKYYSEFQKQLTGAPSDKKLKIATIFSYNVNDEEGGGIMDENPEDTNGLDKGSRDFLEGAIADYNKMFGMSYDTSSDKFQNYYKNVSKRVKNREVDILIVVNMFLTGFDATTLNTLWVDKNLRSHGLLQAYSRTNRILNRVKTFGNIICFRDLEKATNESIALFGDKEAGGIVLLRPYKDYYNGYKDGEKETRGYKSLIQELLEGFHVGEIIQGEQDQKDFIKLYGEILRVRNILTTFDDFEGQEIITDRNMQDYHSMYIDLYNEFRKDAEGEKENINDDVVFEMELIKQIEINIDYILNLIRKYHKENIKDRKVLADINRAIDSSIELRNKKELINQFIASLNVQSAVNKDWHKFVEKKKIEELENIIASENLDAPATYTFIQNAFRDGGIATAGADIGKVLPPLSRFSPTGERTKKRESVFDKLTRFFEKFFDISSEEFSDKPLIKITRL